MCWPSAKNGLRYHGVSSSIASMSGDTRQLVSQTARDDNQTVLVETKLPLASISRTSPAYAVPLNVTAPSQDSSGERPRSTTRLADSLQIMLMLSGMSTRCCADRLTELALLS